MSDLTIDLLAFVILAIASAYTIVIAREVS